MIGAADGDDDRARARERAYVVRRRTEKKSHMLHLPSFDPFFLSVFLPRNKARPPPASVVRPALLSSVPSMEMFARSLWFTAHGPLSKEPHFHG